MKSAYYCPTSHLCIYMWPSILYDITDDEYIYPVRPIQSVLERNTFHGMQYRHVCRYVLCMVMSGKLNTIPSLTVYYLFRVPLLCPFLIELLGQNTLAILLLIDFLFSCMSIISNLSCIHFLVKLPMYVEIHYVKVYNDDLLHHRV